MCSDNDPAITFLITASVSTESQNSWINKYILYHLWPNNVYNFMVYEKQAHLFFTDVTINSFPEKFLL
jgi:hypothetical protein